ncbi:Na(+)/H(+) antiporter subunit C [Arthrobacter sp. MYb227]|uniref:Na(+)/H(+) antiporter subunit C n=1 Tax=Arthrobacter sp. MYb227 TaxID=1848601 RepID=UPI000CFC3DC5|nr:Na(+)/H(+) antiporter subunit C [Arthrobacter sp. MYb227]PQZ96372.1 Na(+)/H(+) antiporter subunit C [Arthrobacter sp. MYb227]
MSTNVTLLIVMGVLFAVGIYLLLERSMTRVLLGIVLLGNGVNLLLLSTAGARGKAPIYEPGIDPGDYTDPLPQALTLTAIVITFAVTAFMLGIIYRSWVLSSADTVEDDDEDLRVGQQSPFDFEEDSPIPEDTSEFDGDEDTQATTKNPGEARA